MSASYTVIHTALKTLSAVCDGAREHDGTGFNGVDTNFGKNLASKESLTEKQALAALKMLKKYSRQLAGYGITLPTTLEDKKPLKATVNYNRTWAVIRFNHVPSLEVRNGIKSYGYGNYKYVPEQNNAWVLKTEFLDSFIQSVQDTMTVEDTTANKVYPKWEI